MLRRERSNVQPRADRALRALTANVNENWASLAAPVRLVHVIALRPEIGRTLCVKVVQHRLCIEVRRGIGGARRQQAENMVDAVSNEWQARRAQRKGVAACSEREHEKCGPTR